MFRIIKMQRMISHFFDVEQSLAKSMMLSRADTQFHTSLRDVNCDSGIFLTAPINWWAIIVRSLRDPQREIPVKEL